MTSPRSPSRTMRILSSAEYCLRVARRISRTSRSDDVSGVPDFCLMSTPQVVTMNPKSSIPQAASFVSQALMSDTAARGLRNHIARQVVDVMRGGRTPGDVDAHRELLEPFIRVRRLRHARDRDRVESFS